MSAIAASYLAPKVEPAAAPQALVGPAGTSPGPLAVRSSALGASPAKMAPSPALEIFYRTPSESIALALNRNSTLNGASTSGTGEVSPAANESSRIRSRNSRRDDSARNPFLDGIPSSADGRAQSEASTSSVTPRHNSAAVPSLFVPDLIPGSSPVKTTKTKKGKTPVKSTNDDAASILNDDFCSACNGIGRFLCCDGCPKSFHFYCLEPPLELDELPPEDEWFCKECRASKRVRMVELLTIMMLMVNALVDESACFEISRSFRSAAARDRRQQPDRLYVTQGAEDTLRRRLVFFSILPG